MKFNVKTKSSSAALFAFACSVEGCPSWGESIYNVRSCAEAKRRHLREVSEAWNGISYRQIRARKIGGPYTSDAFKCTAEYRGLEGLQCGQRVRVGDSEGAVIGHNDSANFEVQFDAGGYAGQCMSVRPAELELL